MTAGNTDLARMKVEREERRARESSRLERSARIRQREREARELRRREHAAACAPLGLAPMSERERREIRDRVRFSGQLHWRVTGAT